ncbi:hypothetical protein Tco_0522538 [Tanacetum coccineum]
MANLKYCDKHNMAAFLKKPTKSKGFTEIVDFLKGSSLRSLLQLANATGINNLPDVEIYEGLITLGGSCFWQVQHQIKGPTITTRPDEAIPTRVEVDTEGANTTASSLDAGLDSGNIHESLLRSNDIPLHDVPTFESVEDIKSLEVALMRKSKNVVVCDSKEKEIEAQGRKIQELDDDPLVSLVEDFVTSQAKSIDKGRRYKRRKVLKKKEISTGLEVEAEVSNGLKDINTGKVGINTGSKGISTGDLGVSTRIRPVSTPCTVEVTIPSLIKGQREGKAPMTEEDIRAPKRSKAQIQQKEAGLAEAIRLQILQEEEVARQVYLDELLAKRIQEEQELTKQQEKRKAEV